MTKTQAKAPKKAKALTKTQIVCTLAERTELSRKEVTAVVDGLCEMIKASLGPKGEGAFTLPGLLRVEKKRVAAKPARKNVPNPFRPGEFHDVPAKPAHDTVKVRALKALKKSAG